MTDPIVVTRNLVKRGWTDFEPKVITGLLTGSAAAFLTGVLAQYGIILDGMQQKTLVVGCYFLGSYLTPSSGTTITRTVQDGLSRAVKQVEGHTGAAVTTITGPTPIQRPAPAPAPAVTNDRDSVTRVLSDPPLPETPDMPEAPDELPTAVLAPKSQNFLNSRFGQTVTDEGGH